VRTILSTWKRPGKAAIEAAVANSFAGGGLLDCLEAGLTVAEADPDFIAIGKGSLPNSEGVLELDASVMVGEGLSAGAVCAVQDLLPMVSLARMVMERTDHVMLAGDQARRFGIEQGMVPQDLMTDEARRRFQDFLDNKQSAMAYVHSVEDQPPCDTVTMLARENGKFVAASSTSGMPFKKPGRVGDSPIVGAGIYADDEAGCAGATGLGEALWRVSASSKVVELMRKGAAAEEACQDVVEFLIKRVPKSREYQCVVLALDRMGNYGAAITHGQYEMYIAEGENITYREYHGIV
jgi:N4-(beta-N-acetylglucosaminyl)-L-asparaginase